MSRLQLCGGLLASMLACGGAAFAQTPPSAAALAAYRGLFEAVARGDAAGGY